MWKPTHLNFFSWKKNTFNGKRKKKNEKQLWSFWCIAICMHARFPLKKVNWWSQSTSWPHAPESSTDAHATNAKRFFLISHIQTHKIIINYYVQFPYWKIFLMRKLCPNYEKVNGLETVLEVPIPEDMWTSIGSTASNRWLNLRALLRAQINSNKTSSSSSSSSSSSYLVASSNNEFIDLLKLVGCPLIPLQVQSDHTLTRPLKDASSIVSFLNFHSHPSFIYTF